jgi:hypothetical protein
MGCPPLCQQLQSDNSAVITESVPVHTARRLLPAPELFDKTSIWAALRGDHRTLAGWPVRAA